ncbi:MAG: hypothetical protein ABJA35_00855 [Parafilimonas sp.]
MSRIMLIQVTAYFNLTYISLHGLFPGSPSTTINTPFLIGTVPS